MEKSPVLPLDRDHLVFPTQNPDDWPPPNYGLLMGYKVPYQRLGQFSLDAHLTSMYDSLDAHILIPSLAYTTNDPNKSSTREVYSGHHTEMNYTLAEIRTMLAGGGEKPASLV